MHLGKNSEGGGKGYENFYNYKKTKRKCYFIVSFLVEADPSAL
jgi:hypothetical protein